MYLPCTPVMADMLRASTGRAARPAALDRVESIFLCSCFTSWTVWYTAFE